MFEAKLSRADAAQPLDRAVGGIRSLRPVTWRDLAAKFDAVRELRAELGSGETAGGASFDPDSARHIAELTEDKPALTLMI